MHRPRHRYGQGNAPAKARGRFRLLAALSLQPAACRRTEKSLRAGLERSKDRIARLHLHGRTLSHVAAERSCSGKVSVGPGAESREPALATVQTVGRREG